MCQRTPDLLCGGMTASLLWQVTADMQASKYCHDAAIYKKQIRWNKKLGMQIIKKKT